MSNHFSRRRLLAVSVGLLAGWFAGGLVAHGQKASNSLEGTWKVTATPDDDSRKAGAREMKLTLTFGPAEFKVEEWVEKGWKPAEYQTDERRFGPTKFDGTLAKEKSKEKAKFSGMATGQDIKGDMTLTKENGDEVKYTFEGQKK